MISTNSAMRDGLAGRHLFIKLNPKVQVITLRIGSLRVEGEDYFPRVFLSPPPANQSMIKTTKDIHMHT